MITMEQAEAARDRFKNEFWNTNAVNGLGITKENDDFALSVYCVDHIPDTLPKEIDGVKLIYRIVGEIRAT